MAFCTSCGSSNPVGARYCIKCGSDIALDAESSQALQTPPPSAEPLVEYLPPPTATWEPASNNYPVVLPPGLPQSREAKAAGGLARVLGLDPRVALIAVVLDSMLFAGELSTFMTFAVISALVGIVFGFITYKAQKSWYGDDHDSALIKGLIMGLLTAIPTPLPAILYVPAGVVGLVKLIRRKE